MLLFSVLLGFSVSLLGFWLSFSKNNFLSKHSSKLMACSLGLFLPLIFFEVIPHAAESGESVRNISLSVFLGIVVFLFFDTFVVHWFKFLDRMAFKTENHESCPIEETKNPSHHHQHLLVSKTHSCSVLGCLIVCCFFDGINLKAVFDPDRHLSWFYLLGLILHILPDGVIVSTMALRSGFKKVTAALFSLILGASLVAGTAVGVFSEKVFKLELLSSFSAGILLYISFVHFLPIITTSKIEKRYFLASLLFFVVVFNMHHLLHDHVH